MTDITKLIDLQRLSEYDVLLKGVMSEEDAKAIKTVLWDSENEQIKFYRKYQATLSDTPDFSIAIASSDVEALKTRVGLSTTLNNYESASNLTAIMNVLTGNTTVAGSVAKIASDEADAAEAAAKSYADGLVAALDADLSASGTAQHSGTFVVNGVTEVDGVITAVSSVEVENAGAVAALDAQLAAVAKSGDAEDVAYDNATSGLAATDVQGALDELAEASAEGVESKTVYITETSGSTGDLYSKRYGIYQGATGSAASPVAGEKLADIDIPKDMVVVSGSVGTVTTPDVPYEGAQVGDKYIDLVIANATSDHIYIPANSLVDIYTAEQSASQIQLVIDNNNEISATIVAGSVTATELASDAVVTAKIQNSAVTTAKIADDAVTADKVAIAAHSESADQTGRTDGLSVTVTTTDGQVSGVTASIAANTYDEYGAAAAAVAALDSSTDDNDVTDTADTSLNLLTSVTIEDGVISAKKHTTIGFASSAEIQALFS